MKSYSLILIFVIFAGLYAGLHFLTGGKEQRVLRVGVECNYAPQNWEEYQKTSSNVPISNKEGSFAEGYDVQIAALVAKLIGAELEVKKIEWGKLLPALNENEIDAIFSSMLDTDARREVADFSETYELHKTIYTLIVNKESKYADSKKLSDFSGAKIIGQADSNLDTVIDQIPGVIHAAPIADINTILNEVRNKNADGFVIDIDTGRTYTEHYSDLIQIELPDGEGFKVGFTGVCAAVRKSDQKLLKEINYAIKKISREERVRIMDIAVAKERDGI